MKPTVFLLFLLAGPVVAAGGQPTKFKVTTKKKDDAVEIRAEKDRTVFSVKCPSGIGQAVIAREGEDWPGSVVLRLHLKGLENFRVSNGTVALAAAVSGDGKALRVRVWQDAREGTPLDATSPLWMDVRPLTGDGKPAGGLPLKGGSFEITLPKAFFAGNPKSIALRWIDFYRN